LSKSQNIDDAGGRLAWMTLQCRPFGDGALVPTLAIIDDGLPDLEDQRARLGDSIMRDENGYSS